MKKTNNKHWVDYKEIKEKVRLEDVLKRYGLWETLKESGQNLAGPCPLHSGTNPRQFSVNLEKSIWHCFGDCNCGGNILDFVAMKEHGDKEPENIRRAALLLKNWFLGEADNGDGKKEKSRTKQTQRIEESEKADSSIQTDSGKVEEEKSEDKKEDPEKHIINPPLRFALTLNPKHPWFAERGILPKTVEYFGLGYCASGIMKERIAIPIHNQNGELVAYCGRALTERQIEEEGKYKLPNKFKKQAVIYNLNRIDPALGYVLLVESYLSVWRLHQAGYGNAAALMGASLSETQERLICERLGTDGRVILLFDPDEAGRKCLKETQERLGSKLFVKIVDLEPVGKKPHQLEKEELQAVVGFLFKISSTPPIFSE